MSAIWADGSLVDINVSLPRCSLNLDSRDSSYEFLE